MNIDTLMILVHWLGIAVPYLMAIYWVRARHFARMEAKKLEGISHEIGHFEGSLA